VNVSSTRRLLAILGTTLLAVPPVAEAQIGLRASTGSGPISGPDSKVIADLARSGVDPRISEAHALFLDHRVMESLQLFEDVIDEFPENFEALCGAARAALAQGLLSRGRQIQNQWYKIGESYARRATEIDPNDLEGLYWLLSAKGLRAVQSGAREASTLGGEVYDLAHQVLEMDSLHAGAYHALGVLNFRVRRLSGLQRWAARNFLGASVMNLTSWEDAERYLTRAVKLKPEYILFHLDLGRMYLNRNRKEEARSHFQRALELPILEPPDSRFQEIAERRLAQTLD
jgi:tetratricopeptide (TPR) repeat protein